MLKPCAVCGELTEQSRCPEHKPAPRAGRRTDTSQWSWIKLAHRAKTLQEWCLLCGSTTDLQVDHSPRAWARDAQRLPIRLCDVTVLCRRCNNAAGTSKPGAIRYGLWLAAGGRVNDDDPTDHTLGGRGTTDGSHVRGEAKFRSQLGMTPNKGASWQG